MRIYNYDPDTKHYLGASEADPDPVIQEAIAERAHRVEQRRANAAAIALAAAATPPRQPTIPFPGAADPAEIPDYQPAWLIPAHATTVAPPATVPAGQVAIWIETAWTLVDLPKPPVTTASGEHVSQDFVADEGQTPEQEQAAHVAWAMKLMQAQLDAVAQGLGYDDIRSLVSYAEEPADPAFQAEGLAGRRWRSLFWRAGIDRLAQVRAGALAAPRTRQALLDGLPEYQPPAAPAAAPTAPSGS